MHDTQDLEWYRDALIAMSENEQPTDEEVLEFRDQFIKLQTT